MTSIKERFNQDNVNDLNDLKRSREAALAKKAQFRNESLKTLSAAQDIANNEIAEILGAVKETEARGSRLQFALWMPGAATTNPARNQSQKEIMEEATEEVRALQIF